MAYARKDYLGTRAVTTLNGAINDSTTSVTITSATGWPTVANTGFYAVIDPNSATEEKVFVTARSGTGLTVTRGVDGSTAASHSSGATIRPCLSAVDFDEANYMVTETVGNVTTAGDLLVGSGTNNLTRLAKGSNSTALTVDSGGTLGYTTVTNAMVNSSAAVSLSKLETISTGYVLGNSSGGTAAPSALSISSVNSTLSGGSTTDTQGSNESLASTSYNSGTSFAPSAVNRPYAFEGVVVYSAGVSAPNLNFRVAVTPYPPVTAYGVTRVAYITTGGAAALATLSALESDALTGTAGVATTKRCLRVSGWMVDVDDVYGMGVEVAQTTTDAGNPITIHAGSYLRYWPLT